MNNNPYHVHLIVEGSEEVAFFDIVQAKGTAENILLTYENADGFGNLALLYQDELPDKDIDCLLIVCDVDFRYYETKSPVQIVLLKMEKVLGTRTKAEKVTIFTNPNIMQVFLLGCDVLERTSLKTSSKEKNTPLIHKYWDQIGKQSISNPHGNAKTKNYDASTWQLEIIKNSFLYDQYKYETLLDNLRELPNDYTSDKTPGSNILPMLQALRTGDTLFFERIMNKIK